jgi:hypothetical protein
MNEGAGATTQQRLRSGVKARSAGEAEGRRLRDAGTRADGATLARRRRGKTPHTGGSIGAAFLTRPRSQRRPPPVNKHTAQRFMHASARDSRLDRPAMGPGPLHAVHKGRGGGGGGRGSATHAKVTGEQRGLNETAPPANEADGHMPRVSGAGKTRTRESSILERTNGQRKRRSRNEWK